MTRAQQLRDNAIDEVARAASEEWYATAMRIARHIASKGFPFTTDDIWARIPPHLTTREPRAMGAIMQTLAREGVIVALNDHRLSKRTACHARPLRLWIKK